MYEGFVKGKWKTSLRRGNPFFRLNDSDSYFKAYEGYINAIFARPNVRLRVAVLAADADIAFGWSVVCGSTLHYVYVANEYRGRGFSRLLVPLDIEKITHLTLIGKSLWRQKMPAAVFDMFA
jgi:GNAT superfamily N-acetyltransferase